MTVNKKPRATISVRLSTYVALREYCETSDESMSSVVERLLGNLLGPTVESTTRKPNRFNPSPGRPVKGDPGETKRAMRPSPVGRSPLRGWNFGF